MAWLRELLLQVLASVTVVCHRRIECYLGSMLLQSFNRSSGATVLSTILCTLLNSAATDDLLFSSKFFSPTLGYGYTGEFGKEKELSTVTSCLMSVWSGVCINKVQHHVWLGVVGHLSCQPMAVVRVLDLYHVINRNTSTTWQTSSSHHLYHPAARSPRISFLQPPWTSLQLAASSGTAWSATGVKFSTHEAQSRWQDNLDKRGDSHGHYVLPEPLILCCVHSVCVCVRACMRVCVCACVHEALLALSIFGWYWHGWS